MFEVSADYLEFHDMSLAEAVAQFDARNGSKIRVRANAARLRVSGRFRADDPRGFVIAVTQILPVRRRLGRDGIVELVKR